MKLRNYFSLLPILIICSVLGILFSSCSSSSKINYNPVYFREGPDTINFIQKEKVIHPYDVLSIQVYSKTPNQEQAAIFNIFSLSMSSAGSAGAAGAAGAAGSVGTTGSSGSMQGYRVNDAGNIEMPVIGTISTTGLTIYQLQDYISQKVANYVKSPAVIVHYLQFDVNVLGEVRYPGIKKFTTDRVTVLDAISASGDLTDFGKRNDITVIRSEAGKQVFFKADIRNRNIFKSPVYLLQPNDIVYVNPDKYKLENLSISPKAQKNTALIFGIIGISLSIATLLVALKI
jgi:polysaccharide export outer membrane protein